MRRVAIDATDSHGTFHGWIELLQDKNIPWNLLPPDGQYFGGDPCEPLEGTDRQSFCETAAPLHPALLRLVTKTGQQLTSLTLERPLAEVTTTQLYQEQRPTYRVTVDLSVEFGSYAGPLTRFAEVRDGVLQWISAVDVTGKHSDILLASTLKSAWRLAPASNGGLDILSVTCRPEFDDALPDGSLPFKINLTRYSFDGEQWRQQTRVEDGVWEDEGEFPTRERFP